MSPPRGTRPSSCSWRVSPREGSDMYLTFYGLRDRPFNATPDPRFLYMSPGHREALAQLLYGTQERKGFIVLTGKVGTGKTTLLHTLCQRLNGQSAIAFVVNSTLPFDDLLEYVLEDLGIKQKGESRAQRLIALNNFLIERERAGQNTILIVDEAQNLDVATLEQIRLLSNFETPTSKLLQILLVGQPELKARLNLPELRQLKQRVGLRCQIPPLTLEEACAYIRTRYALRVDEIWACSPTRPWTGSRPIRAEFRGSSIPSVITASCSGTRTRSAASIGTSSTRRSSIWRRASDRRNEGES